MDWNQYTSGFHYYGGAGGAPMAPPRGPSFLGLDPGQGGAVGGLLQSVGPMIAEMFREQFGGYAFMFGSDMNVGSARMANQFLKQLGQARNKGAEADKEQVKQIFRGLAVAIGNKLVKGPDGKMDLEPDVLRSIDVLSNDAATMLPILAASFPDTIDKLLPRGSMAVAATSFVNSGRFVIDPKTGRPASEDSDMASRILKPLLQRGPQETYGLGAGRLGQVYEELVSRGMISSGRDLRESVEARETSKGLFGIGMGGDEARNIQGDRIRERIRSYSRTISAINDVFAENGKSDASLPELVRSLEALTQGGMSVYDPNALARITRSIQAASQVSGIGIQGLTQLAAYSGSVLEQAGAHRGLAAPITLRAAAYGMNYKFEPGPESMDRNEFIQGIAANQAAFAGSPVGNALGAISALGRNAPEGSDFAALAEAVRKGESRVELPKSGRTIDLTSDLSQVAEIARQSGLGGAYLQQLMATTINKAEYIREPGMMLAGQRLQRTEFENLLLTQLGAQFSGVDPEKLMSAIYSVKREGGVTGDVDLAKKVGEKMGLSAEMRASLGTALSLAGGKTRGSTGHTAVEMFDPERAKAAEKSLKFMEDRGMRFDESSSLMRGGAIRNITNMIVQGGQEGGFRGLGYSVLRGLGLVTNEDIAKSMSGGLDPTGEPIKPFTPLEDLFGMAFKNNGSGLFGNMVDPILKHKGSGAFGNMLEGFGVTEAPQIQWAEQPEPEYGGALSSLIARSGKWARGEKVRNRLLEGATDDDAGGMLGGAADWAAKTERKSRLKSDAAESGRERGPLQVSVAKLIISRDGTAKLNSEGAVS